MRSAPLWAFARAAGCGLGILMGSGRLAGAPQQPTAQEPAAVTAPETAERAGRFRIGPVYVTPSIRVGTIGLDTNVFYTPTDRQTDVTASGGPGLELVLPIRQTTRLSVDGFLSYLYFVRTESQRRLNGAGRAAFEWTTPRTRLRIEEVYERSYGRPSLEVDRRVQRTTEMTQGEIKQRVVGRVSLLLGGGRARHETDDGQTFLGADLGASLTRDEHRARAGLEYALTIKTAFVVEGDYATHRHPRDEARDADTVRVLAGFRTNSTALIAGRALAGVRSFRPARGLAPERRTTAVDVDALLNWSPRTKIGGSYGRDLAFSAFSPDGGTPTLRMETYGARIDKDLVARFNLQLFGRITRLVTDGAIRVEVPGGQPVVAVRDDTTREAGADLGYRFRPRLRIGVAAVYTDRRSTISYFGIDGLLVGATVMFTP